MNKILVNNGVIDAKNCDVIFENDTLVFNKDGNYLIEYVNTDNISLTFCINNGVVVNLQEISFDNDIVVKNRYIIEKGSLIVNKFYSNKSVLEDITVDLNSRGANINYNFSSVCILNEKYSINVNHNAIGTISNINNRSVTLKNSRLDFVINSSVLKDMKESILNQTTKVITFDDSIASVCPNMFIDCNDVVAKHGSFIGTIDENIIFYLMSRGISYDAALKLYIKGFLFSDVIVDFDIKSRILTVIDMYWR